MSAHEFQAPETTVPIIRRDPDYSICLLEGGGLIFFPA